MSVNLIGRSWQSRGRLNACSRSIQLGLLLLGSSLVGCERVQRQEKSLSTGTSLPWQEFLRHDLEPAESVAGHASTGSVESEIKPNHSVSSATCIECHAGQVASYQSTSHYDSARWIQDSGAHVPTKFTHKRSSRSYEVTTTGNSLAHSETITAPGGELIALDSAEMALEVGSGLHAHSYLMRRDGFWIQSPLTWYSQPQQWDLSPGYDPTHQATFDRLVTTNCAFCHVGQIRILGNDIHRFSIEEVSIGCERCHGPADQHVAVQRARLDLGELEGSLAGNEDCDDIINPANLSRERQEAVCSQCHLQGVVNARSNGFNRWDFAPGELLSDSITEYQLEGVDSRFRIVGHTEQLHASACYLRSETLTCVTCHDPHAPPPSKVQYRESCIECHLSESCGLPEDDRIRSQNNDCSVCHMPIRPTDVTHAALSDHRIAIHDRSYVLAGREVPDSHRVPRSSQSSTTSLVPITDESRLDAQTRQRRWALAMHSLAFQGLIPEEFVPEFQRAKALLLGLQRKGITDASVQVYLAKDYLEANLFDTARSLADRVISNTVPGQLTYLGAADVLGQVALREQDNQTALHWYRQLTQLRRLSGDFFVLGMCESNAGNVDAAVAAYEQALRIDPTLVPAHENLARILHERGNTDRSALHQATIMSLRARMQQIEKQGGTLDETTHGQ